jgi:hypothetical protein
VRPAGKSSLSSPLLPLNLLHPFFSLLCTFGLFLLYNERLLCFVLAVAFEFR